MKRLIMTIAIGMMMVTTSAKAQVFIDDDDVNANRNGSSSPALGVFVPEQDVDYDQYTPVGGGLLLLTGMAGAYLMGKRKKEE